jgi:prepilin-type N-terminal cleavage/methylation domain-containing protein
MKSILKNKKGFTLMEIIVVLIIIAIMAAALIPSFINFARNARANEYIAQARVGMTSAQAMLTQDSARGIILEGDNLSASAPAGTQTIAAQVAAAPGTVGGDRFRNNMVGDMPATYSFGGVNVTGFRVDRILYSPDNAELQLVGVAGGAGGWLVSIDDALGITEFWRAGQARGSEGNNRPA